MRAMLLARRIYLFVLLAKSVELYERQGVLCTKSRSG